MEERMKENGCALEPKTERGMEKEAQREQKGSTELGKFKDVNALLQAYTALEAEFTRRSQRLKALERETENERVEQTAVCEGETSEEAESAEKCASSEEQSPAPVLEKACTTTKTEVRGAATETASLVAKKEEGSFSCAESSVRNTQQTFADDELYSAVLANETVRLKVIGEYLNSIGKKGAPMMRGGTGTLAVQPSKAKSIDSAGVMALHMFKAQSQHLG